MGMPMDALPADCRPDPRGFGLVHDAWGRLVLIDADGYRHVGVEPIRAFPLTDPRSWISLVDADGREILCVESLDDLPAETRRKVEQELAAREFVPEIRRVVAIHGETSPSEWEVETDRGPTRFQVDGDDSVRRIGESRVLIHDAQGLRYHVADTRRLDQASLRLLDRYL